MSYTRLEHFNIGMRVKIKVGYFKDRVLTICFVSSYLICLVGGTYHYFLPNEVEVINIPTLEDYSID